MAKNKVTPLPPPTAVPDTNILTQAPPGTVLYNDLSSEDQINAYRKAQAYVLSRFVAPTTIDDLPLEVQQAITAANAEHPSQVVWTMATDPACAAWVDAETLRLCKQKAYRTAEQLSTIEIEQL